MKDVIYEKAVNAFIPKAEKIADAVTKKSILEWMDKKKFDGTYNELIDTLKKKDRQRMSVLKQEANRLWDYTFHREMIRLTREANIRQLTINGNHAEN